MATESRSWAQKVAKKPTVLFLCTGNSCRSQMAEGWARQLRANDFLAYSAGIEAHGLNPNAVVVMVERGVDITGQQSQTVADLAHVPLDLVITVCSHADSHCPAWPDNTRVVHVDFDDPPGLAKSAKNEDQAIAIYRRVRDEIRAFVVDLKV